MHDHSNTVSRVLSDVCAIPRDYMDNEMILGQFCNQDMMEDLADAINHQCGTRIKPEVIVLNMTIGELYQVVNDAAASGRSHF
jgi:hypothetical protein